MRSAVAKLGKNPKIIEPLVPVDLVVDHSVQVDFAGSADALQQNLELEFKRNRERYQFLKWGMQAFDTFKVVPPGIGIVHQVNLEYLAKGVLEQRRRLLSRHARRHRLAHHDDQRPRHRRLGRRRHRGRGRHARPAGLFPHARRRRRAPHRRAPRRRHRDRPRAHASRRCCARRRSSASSSSSSARARRRCRSWTARPSPTWRPNTARRWASSRSTRRCCNYLARHRPQRRRTVKLVRELLQGAGPVGHSAGRARSTTRRSSNSTSPTVSPSVAGPKRPQDRIELPNLKAASSSCFTPVAETASARRRRLGRSRRW